MGLLVWTHSTTLISSRITFQLLIMQNEAGEYVDMYIPRKCSASNRILSARDHASIQINLASVDESTGRMTGGFTTYAICGAIRRMGESTTASTGLPRRMASLTRSSKSVLSPDLLIIEIHEFN